VSEPQYDRETLRKVTAKAARLQSEQELRQSGAYRETFTAAEMDQVGSEVGLDPALMRQALGHVTAEEAARRRARIQTCLAAFAALLFLGSGLTFGWKWHNNAQIREAEERHRRRMEMGLEALPNDRPRVDYRVIVPRPAAPVETTVVGGDGSVSIDPSYPTIREQTPENAATAESPAVPDSTSDVPPPMALSGTGMSGLQAGAAPPTTPPPYLDTGLGYPPPSVTGPHGDPPGSGSDLQPGGQ
jgi:hypothetical protein